MYPDAELSSFSEYPGGQVTTEQIGAGVTVPGLYGGSLGMHLNCAHSCLGALTAVFTSGLSRENAWFGRGGDGRPRRNCG